jgi:hypothetical protein
MSLPISEHNHIHAIPESRPAQEPHKFSFRSNCLTAHGHDSITFSEADSSQCRIGRDISNGQTIGNRSIEP